MCETRAEDAKQDLMTKVADIVRITHVNNKGNPNDRLTEM